MPRQKKHPVDSLPERSRIMLAAQRLAAQHQNGHLTDVRVALAFLGPYALIVLLEMSILLTPNERSVMAHSLLYHLEGGPVPRPMCRRELRRLAELQLDAEQR